jgi:hypothetical protein
MKLGWGLGLRLREMSLSLELGMWLIRTDDGVTKKKKRKKKKEEEGVKVGREMNLMKKVVRVVGG